MRLPSLSLAFAAAALLVPAAAAASAIGFEESEGFAPGADVAASAAWKQSPPGVAQISPAEKQGGRQSLKIAAAAGDAAATTSFPIPADGIVFLDFAILPTADGSKTPLSTIDANGATLGFVKTQDQGRVVALTAPGDKGAAPNAADAGHSFEVDEGGLAVDWLRLTIRENLKAGTWDLYVDGRLALIDQPLLAKVPAKNGALSFLANPAGPSYADNLSISGNNPLFPDADKDGIPDAVEMVNGTNPYFDDRQADLNADGQSNLRNFLAGASIGTPAVSRNAGRTVIYVDGRLGDDRFSGVSSYRMGGAEGPKATLPAAIRGNDADAAFALLPADKPYLLVERSRGTEDTVHLIPLGDISITTDPKDIQP